MTRPLHGDRIPPCGCNFATWGGIATIVVNRGLQGPFGGENRSPRQAVSVISKGKSGAVLPPAAHTGATSNLAEGRCTANEGRLLAIAVDVPPITPPDTRLGLNLRGFGWALGPGRVSGPDAGLPWARFTPKRAGLRSSGVWFRACTVANLTRDSSRIPPESAFATIPLGSGGNGGRRRSSWRA